MQSAMSSRPFNLGGRAAFDTLMSRMRSSLDKARSQAEEMRQMLEGSFRQLNTEFGFAFALGPMPVLETFAEELARIEHNYARYLGLGQALRMASPGFAEQFRRMLLSKLRVVFENAAGEAMRRARWKCSCASAAAPSRAGARRCSACRWPRVNWSSALPK